MRLVYEDLTQPQLILLKDFAEENPELVQVSVLINFENPKEYQLHIKTKTDSILRELSRRIKNLTQDQELLRHTYNLPAYEAP